MKSKFRLEAIQACHPMLDEACKRMNLPVHHAHTCPACVFRWTHGDLNRLFRRLGIDSQAALKLYDAAHACPNCATEQFYKDISIDTPPTDEEMHEREAANRRVRQRHDLLLSLFGNL